MKLYRHLDTQVHPTMRWHVRMLTAGMALAAAAPWIVAVRSLCS